MTDAPILITQKGSHPVPYAYTVPGSQEIQPTAIEATFDGTGASGAFRPCVSFYAQSGERIARVFPADTVAAGEVCEVTYAPFLRDIGAAPGGAAHAGATARTIYRDSSGAFVLPSGGLGAFLEWQFYEISDSDVFVPAATPSATHPIDTLIAGVYLMVTDVLWPAGTYVKQSYTVGPGSPAVGVPLDQNNAPSTTSLTSTRQTEVYTATGGDINTTGLHLFQNSGSDITIVQAYQTTVWLSDWTGDIQPV